MLNEIKSYTIRDRKLSENMEKSFEQLQYCGLIAQKPDRLCELLAAKNTAVAGGRGPIIVEVGFGMCGSVLNHAKLHPDKLFVGVEVLKRAVLLAALKAKQLSINNILFAQMDALELIEETEDSSLQGILIPFPDPWPKKRHQKRRIIRASTLSLFHRKLADGGKMLLKTDDHDYYEYAKQLAKASSFYLNEGDSEVVGVYDAEKSKYHLKADMAGREIYSLTFSKDIV